MPDKSIWIVEDELIVAEDIKVRLQKSGYIVGGIFRSGEEVIRRIEKHNPDLILMDIKLDGNIDGIETAKFACENHGIPVIFITAYADKEILGRAMSIHPFGYILKPIESRELKSAVRNALEKHDAERKLHYREKWLSGVLNNIGCGLVFINTDGDVEYINPPAETLLGWKSDDIVGTSYDNVLIALGKDTRLHINDRISSILESKPVVEDGEIPGQRGYSENAHSSRETRFPGINPSLVKDDNGDIVGVLLIINDSKEHGFLEDRLHLTRYELKARSDKYRRRIEGIRGESYGRIIGADCSESGKRSSDSMPESEENLLENRKMVLDNLLERMEKEKKVLTDHIQSNIEAIVMPMFKALKTNTDSSNMEYLNILEKSLNNITSPFINKIKIQFPNLTPREVEVSNMIRNGLSSKEIAAALSISVQTAIQFRKLIRKKLGISNQKVNLRTFLQRY